MARSRDLTTSVLRFGHMLRASGMPLTIGLVAAGQREDGREKSDG